MPPNKIRYPKQSAKPLPRDFVAFGTAKKGVTQVKGILKDGQLLVSEGTTIHLPPRWVILFENVAEGNGYQLEVEFTGDGTVQPQTVTEQNLHVQNLGQTGVLIQYPVANDQVCRDEFYAYGTTTNTSATVGGVMTDLDASKDFPGTSILRPTSRGVWAIQFLNLDVGNNYQLTVTDSAGAQKDELPIVVTAAVC
jgi:hypothetical protein